MKKVMDLSDLQKAYISIKKYWSIRDELLFFCWILFHQKTTNLLQTTVWDLSRRFSKGHILYPLRNRYTKTYPALTKQESNFIFFNIRSNTHWSEHIWYKQLRKLLKQRTQWNYTNSSLRRTWWRMMFYYWMNIREIQKAYNQRNINVTMKYIEIDYTTKSKHYIKSLSEREKLIYSWITKD